MADSESASLNISRVRGAVINRGDTSAFDMLAGRSALMLFLGPQDRPEGRAALDLVERHRDLFDDVRASFVVVSLDPPAAGASWRGRTAIQDGDMKLARQFGVVRDETGGHSYRPGWFLLDIRLRIVDHAPLADGERIFDALRDYLAIDEQQAIMPAPVLIVPRLFEPELCRQLIDIYEREGGQESGFIDIVDARPTRMIDSRIKRRSDFYIKDQGLQKQLGGRIAQVLFPMIHRAFNFRPTRIERFNIVCYDGEQRGFFRPHRDNVTALTQHRRFACTINLNAGEYEGGALRFPEYGAQTYSAPTGGAVIFSCGLLHEALPVTRGKRYAFLPFLYDEEGHRHRIAYENSQGDRTAASPEQPEAMG